MLIFDPKEDSKAFFFHGVQQKGRDLSKKSHKDMKFLFDRVFSTDCSTTEVFQGSTHALIDSLMDGYNCSVFAYGATGAGKTFTMSGSSTSPGITYLTMTELFRKHEELEVEREFEVGVTYLEVYNELVRDLLNPGPPLDLREDPKYGVTVAGIKVHRIKDPKELFALLDEGNKHRTQHPTDANAESSRSHAVFQVYLQMTMKSTREVCFTLFICNFMFKIDNVCNYYNLNDGTALLITYFLKNTVMREYTTVYPKVWRKIVLIKSSTRKPFKIFSNVSLPLDVIYIQN